MNALSTVNANTFYFLNNIAVDISYGLTYYYTFDISTNNTNISYLKNLATQVYDLSLVGTLVTSSPTPKYGLSSLYLNNQTQPINNYSFVQTSGVTISFWTYYNITPTTSPILFFLGNSSTNFGVGINNYQNLYYYINGTSYSTSSNVGISSNTWTNITLSLDSSNKLNLYKSGALADQRSNVTITSGSYPIYLGGGAPSSSVSGNIYTGYTDDFRLYNNCLNGRQIQNISKFAGIAGYSNPVDPVGLMSYYRFEPTDVSGNTVSNFAGYLYNSTYNNLSSYTPVYDASLTNTTMVSYKKYNIGYGTFDLSNSNYLQIQYIPPLTNNGLSFSFWMRSNNSYSGYYPLFDFGNGGITDNIKFGIYNNKIVSSIQNGNTSALSFNSMVVNALSLNVTVGNVANTVISNTTPGALIGPCFDVRNINAQKDIKMAGWNVLFNYDKIPQNGNIYPLSVTQSYADWIAVFKDIDFYKMIRARIYISVGNAFVYSSESRYTAVSGNPFTTDTDISNIWYKGANNNTTAEYNSQTSGGYAIYSINFSVNISNLGNATYSLSNTGDMNTIYSCTYSNTGGDIISYSTFDGTVWSLSSTLYNGIHINGIRVSADGSKGAFITADTSLCYFFTKSENTYSPTIGSNIASFTSTNIISTGYNLNLTGLDMSLDGSRIVVSSQGTGGNIYYTNWNSTTNTYNSPFTLISNIGSADYKGVAISPDKYIIVFGVNSTNTVKYSLWNSSGNYYSTPYTLSTTVGPPANFKFNLDGSILFYSLNGNTTSYNLYYSVWNGVAFNGFTSVNSVGANLAATGLDVLPNNTVYVYNYGGGGTGVGSSNVISYSITNNTTLTSGNLYTTSVNDNVWRHYAWTIDPSNQQYNYYINGNISSNISGNSLTFPTAMNMNNNGLILYYPLQNNTYNYIDGTPKDDAIGKIKPSTDNLTNYYTFDKSDLSNNLLLNRSTYNYDATITSNVILQGNIAYGIRSSYLYVPNNTDYVLLPDFSMNIGFSISFWYNSIIGTAQYPTIFRLFDSRLLTNNNLNYGSLSLGFNHVNNDCQLVVSTSTSTSNTYRISCTKVDDTKWHHLVFIADNLLETSCNISIWADGINVNNSTITGYFGNTIITSVGSCNIKLLNGRSDRITTYLDDLRIYNRILTQTDVKYIYNPIKSLSISNGLNSNSIENYPYLSIPTISQNINGYSFSFWFNSSTNNQTGIIWSFNNSTNLSTNRIFMGLQGGNIQIGTGSTTYTSTIQPTINTSNYYVWTMSTNGTSNIYLNGNTSSFITTNTVPYYQNGFDNNGLFSDPTGGNTAVGTITEFRYYDRILSSNDITQLYGNSVSRTQNIIGASNSLTSFFTGGVDEFQIYNRVLTSNEVSRLSTIGTYYNLQGNAASSITGLTSNVSGNITTISYNSSTNYVKNYNIAFSPTITASPFTTNLLSTSYTGFIYGTYTANVYAVGLYGNSAVANTTFTGIGVPAAPTGLTATGMTANTISVSFTTSVGATSYTATAIPTSGSNVIVSGITLNTVTITGLQTDMNYTITMVAINSWGNSNPSSSITYSTKIPLTSISPSISQNYYSSGGINYIYYSFVTTGTSNKTYSASINTYYTSFDYLIVAGGGGGGLSVGSGGGGGGVLSNTISGVSGTISITVGGGGLGMQNATAVPVNGNNSSFTIVSNSTTVTALGGGGGSGQSYSYNNGSTTKLNPPTGGSGGGQTRNGTIGYGTNGQGNNGGTYATNDSTYYNAGGGGGAGQVGQNATSTSAGTGGNGISSSITGTSVYYGGGGGGSAELYGITYSSAAAGGLGGGGSGDVGVPNASSNNKTGSNGTDGLGGGGGGSDLASPVGRQGGSGIVIIRFVV